MLDVGAGRQAPLGCHAVFTLFRISVDTGFTQFFFNSCKECYSMGVTQLIYLY
jgi:hypothetical protein